MPRRDNPVVRVLDTTRSAKWRSRLGMAIRVDVDLTSRTRNTLRLANGCFHFLPFIGSQRTAGSTQS
jgi:hypothetical protein